MKKLASLLVALAMLCVMLPATAEGIPTGEWYLISMQMGETAVDPAAFGMNLVLTLNEDGTCTMDSGDGDPAEGTWTFDDNGLTITEADSEQTLAYEDGQLKLDMSDGCMIFSQEKAAPVELPQVVPAESEDAFFGNWVLANVGMGGMVLPAEAAEITMTVNIEAGKAVFSTGEDEVTVDTTFADGALTFVDSTSDTEIKLETTDDGNISFTQRYDEETAMVFYFVKADAE